MSGHRLVRLAAVIALLVTCFVAAAPPDRAGAASCSGPFGASFRAELDRTFPGQRVTAAVHDLRTGCWYHLNRGMRIETASVVKIQFLAGALLRAQDERRGLTSWERARVAPMMQLSHNPPASDLYLSLGGAAGMERLDGRLGAGATTHPTSGTWGATVSTAEARTWVVLSTLWGGPLRSAGRAEAWRWMTSVHPTQQWGITAGVPAGWTVALKNGFYPTSGTPRWRIGSSGLVRDDRTGLGYAITIMTDRNVDHLSGQRVVEHVSRRVASTLTGGAPAPRAVERSQCVTTARGESWSRVAARLGTSDAAGVRSVSGGPTSPVTGMRACRPDLRTPYDPNGPNADFVRGLYQTFLGRSPAEGPLRSLTTSLDSGQMSRRRAARSIVESREHLGRVVDQLYVSVLGRPADPGGRRSWVNALDRGMTVADATARMMATAEFARRTGNTDRGFVDGAYLVALGRPADPASSSWVAALRSGWSRRSVATGLLGSSESLRRQVTVLYLQVLGRGADASGIRSWSPVVRREGAVSVAATLASSAEFYGKSQR